MDYRLSPSHVAFRDDLIAFLDSALPSWWSVHSDREQGTPEQEKVEQEFVGQLKQRGWLTMGWPTEYGGFPADHITQLIYTEELSYRGAPMGDSFGLKLAGPSIMLHGNDAQRARFLPPIAHAEVRWCEGFSEPGAGSDLAGLQTRADRDGDVFVINGQKIWTTGGHRADWIFFLARSDQSAPKHRGITFFVADIKTPGITIRPLVNLMGTHKFNEVFFDDVRIPIENVIGEPNRGWYVATSTLDMERSGIGRVTWTRKLLEELIEFMKDRVLPSASPGSARRRRSHLADLWIAYEVARQLCYRVAWMQSAGVNPNAEASMSKLFATELNSRAANLGMGVLDAMGQLEPGSHWAPLAGRIERAYMGAASHTIAGGTSEIQRNIIATRGLGLPRGS